MELLPLHELAIAAGLGLLIGLQREWSEHGVAGIRTFPIIALFGCFAGLSAETLGSWTVAAGLLALGAVVLAARFELEDKDVPGTTTQIACLLVYLLSAGLAVGFVTEAVVTAGFLVVLLHWKKSLHGFVRRIGRQELHAVVQMALVGLVILPVLPNRAFGPYAVINPFEIWLMVVLIVGISLAAYLLSRLVRSDRGALLAGILGGLISSTATTVSYSHRSKDSESATRVAASVILIATPVVFARVMVEVAVVAPAILPVTLPPLSLAMVLMIGLAWLSFRNNATAASGDADQHPPSDLGTAIGFGLLYMLVLVAAAAARDYFGNSGLYAVAAISGLTDMDAITLSSAQLVKAGQLAPTECWRVILVGAMANLAFKFGVIAALGHRELKRRTAPAFGISILGCGLLLLFWP